VHLNLDQANAILAGDSALAPLATTRLREELERLGTYEVIDAARVDSASQAVAGHGVSCTTDACALATARALGAGWALTTRLSKISTPVWFVDARLLNVTTGRAARVDQFEIKGAPQQMIPQGMAVVARRMSEAGRAESTGSGK
jgi:hypothetical protein